VWDVLHNPKYTGYQVWNRRAKRGNGRVNPPEKWIWSQDIAHEPLVSKEMFDRANIAGARRENVARSRGDLNHRRHSYVLRSFVRCGICGLRMQGDPAQP
jgi:site-specific DNA recombinase